MAVLPQDQLTTAYQQAYAVLWQSNSTYLSLKNAWQRIVDDAVNVGKTVTAVGSAQIQPLVIATTFVMLFGLVLVLIVGWVVNATISVPLRNLANLTDMIAQGQTDVRASTTGRDEIATVASGLNHMLDNIVNLIQQTQSQRDLLQAQVEKLVSEVCNAGEGDLRVQAEVASDALGVLADSFNYMVEELAGLVVHVKVVAQEVQDSTTLTFESMSQLVESADTQIQQIGGAAVEAERLASSSKQVAERAQSLYITARSASQTAQFGRGSVSQSVKGMGRINTYVQETALKMQALGDSSREIGSIVTLISNIAHQTNRLALDAAIQAAMAGENGKGFGAVAADIRRQAEQAKEQTTQITRIVRNVHENINAVAVSMQETEHETSLGAQLALEVSAALDSIFSVIESQGREIESINEMAAQQFQSSNAIVQTMYEVARSTQRSSQSTHTVAQNMERLSRLAEQLLASVEVFKLPAQPDYTRLTGLAAASQHSQPKSPHVASGPFRMHNVPPSSTPLPPLLHGKSAASTEQNPPQAPIPNRTPGKTEPRTISRPLRPAQAWQDINRDRQQ